MKPRRHWKLTDAHIHRLREQALLHSQLVPYPQLADEMGVSHQNIRQIMADLIREARLGIVIVRRGTNNNIVDEVLRELGA